MKKYKFKTYAEEKALKDAEKTKSAQRYVFNAVGWDKLDRRAHTPKDGTVVIKTQPYGCPTNGTMGHCFIADLDGGFIGLVNEHSLTKMKMSNNNP